MRKGNQHLSTGFSMLYYTFFTTKMDDRQKLVFIQLKFEKIAMENSYHILYTWLRAPRNFAKLYLEVVACPPSTCRQADGRKAGQTKNTVWKFAYTMMLFLFILYIYTEEFTKKGKEHFPLSGRPPPVGAAVTIEWTHNFHPLPPCRLASRIKPLCSKT